MAQRARPARPASIRMLASVTRRAKRSGLIAASPRPPSPSSPPARARAARPAMRASARGAASAGAAFAAALARGAPRAAPAARANSSTSSAGPSRRACAPSPSTHETSCAGSSSGGEDDGRRSSPSPSPAGRSRRSARSDVRSARRSARREDLGDARSSPSCQSARLAYARGSKSAGRLEVVLGLGRVGDLAADPRQPEDADRLALVGVAEQVELAALEQQVVRIDAARADLVALHRVVVEHDRLVAEDRRLDLGQARGQLVPAGRRGDAERHRALLGRAQRAGAPPGDLLQRQPQRLGVGEFAVEQVSAVCSAASSLSVNAIGGRWKFSGRSE